MVKIRRLLVENFLILKEIMGKDKIEIFFSDNLLCLIIGKNGSGKSFLMSLLTPSPQDLIKNRSGSPVIKGKVGRKEIDIELDQKYLYKCVITYNNKTTCFIHKYNLYTNEDLGELNPNGNVNTYYEVLDKELGWSKNYINVGYLSSGITNLIMMKPAERNDYIAVWLPELSEFIDAFKVISKKINILKKQIDLLNNDIGKLTNEDYDILIDNYENNLKELEKKYYELLNFETKCDTFINIIPKINRDDLIKRINSLKDLSKNLLQERQQILDEQILLTEYSGKKGNEKLQFDLNFHKSEIDKLTEKLKNIENNILNLQNEMMEIKNNDNNFNNNENIFEIENTLNVLNNELNELISIKNNILKNNSEYSELEDINKGSVDTLSLFVNDTLLNLRDKITNLIPFEMLDNNDILTNNNNKLYELKELYEKQIEKLDKEILEKSNRIYSLKNSKINSELLKLRPNNCNFTCGIINELLLYINPETEINKLTDELNKFIKEKSGLNDKLSNTNENIRNINLAISFINEINDKIIKNKDLISLFPDYIRKYFIIEDICYLLNKIPELNDKINNYKDYIYLIDKINSLKDSIKNTNIIFELLKQKKSMDEKWVKLNNKFLDLSKERLDIIKNFDSNENKYKFLLNIKDLSENNTKRINLYNEKAKNLLEEKNILINMNKNLYYYLRLSDIKSDLEIKINTTKLELDDMNNKLNILKNKKNSIKTLMDTRDNLLNKKKLYDILSNIWSPKVGYPSWEMEDFLDTLTEQTNNDLSKMWGSELKIESFNIGANEFSIVINKDGVLIKDASECSDGERATLSLAISFAIIEINLRYKKYNVLRFDEVDAPLDYERRRTFCETILERLPDLDCGNLIMTTHNNEFSNVDADIIILEGADEDPALLSNKNIIYHY